MRGRNQLEQASGTMPMLPNTKPNRALSDAMRMSIASGNVAPTPTAAPLMAAITGFVQSKIASTTRPPVSRTPRTISGSSRRWSRSCMVGCSDSSRPNTLPAVPDSPSSMPAQNARPAPVTTMARTASSALARSKASISSSAISTVKALSRSGRFRRSVRMPSCTLVSMVW